MTDDLSKLSDLEHVRTRPSMYIGDTTARGLHHLVVECIDYANNRCAKNVTVSLSLDGSVSVTDDGTGREVSALEPSMTLLKYDGVSLISGGFHGVGVVVVNYLCANCAVVSTHGGKTCRQSYQRGVAIDPVEVIGDAAGDGMRISFLPDPEIFATTELRYSVIEKRLRELAFLRPGIRCVLKDERSGATGTFFSEHGSSDFVRSINRGAQPIHPVLNVKGGAGGIMYDVAFQYTKGFGEHGGSYGNDVETCQGGGHRAGFRRALVDRFRALCRDLAEPIAETQDTETFFDGLTSVVVVRVDNPKWEGSTRTKLVAEGLDEVVYAGVDAFLERYFSENRAEAMAIVRKLNDSERNRAIYPPIDYQLLNSQQRRLRNPEEARKEWYVWFPNSYRVIMEGQNGGRIRVADCVWDLFPVRDESSEESLRRTQGDVVEQTLLAYSNPGIPVDALVVARNEEGDLLVFIRRTDHPHGEAFPNPYADELYRWDPASHELTKIADDFDEFCRNSEPIEQEKER